MIEIRELVIRATVDDSPRTNGRGTSGDLENKNEKGCCDENLDLMLKIIKEKKER
jgi:hypothetical protein